MGRSRGGFRDHGACALDHRSGTERPRRRPPAERPGAPQGWRPAASVEPGRYADQGPARRHRARHARRSHAPAVVGIEKPRQGGRRVAEAGPRDQRQQREETVADARLQPAVEPQGRRGLEASRPQCAIRAHQRQGDRGADRGAARHLGRHQEERADRQLQERWHRLSPERRSAAREGARLLGKVVPYGVYDVGANAGWVSVGVTSDTAQFAVASIRRWLDAMGRERYPKARELTITADGGGSNGTRVRLWKVELQKLADETGLVLHVHHYPPGTSKWNKIEHRLFCHITQTGRGRPLVDRMAVFELIAATTTKAGLKVESALDTATYEKGIKVSDAEMKTLDIQGDAFHPEWNYTIRPRLIANRSFGECP